MDVETRAWSDDVQAAIVAGSGLSGWSTVEQLELLARESSRVLSIRNRYRVAEFGVGKGASAGVLGRVASERGARLFLYDTFRGCPAPSDRDVEIELQLANHEGKCAGTALEVSRYLEGLGVRAIYEEGDVTRLRRLPVFGFVNIDLDYYPANLHILQLLDKQEARVPVLVNTYWGTARQALRDMESVGILAEDLGCNRSRVILGRGEWK